MSGIAVAFHTLGCRLNQLETEAIADAFADAGMRVVPFSSPADIHVVNTCTVTGKAEQKARRIIRQALTRSPRAVVLATGCYAQMDGAAIASLGDRVVVIPGDVKQAIMGLASFLADNSRAHGDLLEPVAEWKAGLWGVVDRFAYRPETFLFHSRPSLKIQDGCDNRCSYCRVCLARGPSVSLDPAEILERVARLEEAGKAEIQLTGVNLSQYRHGETRFPGLLAKLLAATRHTAFRISSFEPDRIDEGFLEVFAHPRVRPHLHLALQSGSDDVLGRMGREYTANTVLRAVEALRYIKDDPFIGADIIAGFPGESEAEFDRTLELCRALDLAHIHAFPYSPRPGTAAFDMRPQVPERVSGERVAVLAILSEDGLRRYVLRQAGRRVPVVIESDDVNGGSGAPIFPETHRSEIHGRSGRLSPLPLVPSPAGYLRPPSRIHGCSARGTSANFLKILVHGIPDPVRPGDQVFATIRPDRCSGESDLEIREGFDDFGTIRGDYVPDGLSTP